jgi:penicillin-binding protein 2
VYDREGRIIIDSRPSYTVSVVPAEEVKNKTVPNLASLIGLDTSQVRKRIRRNLISRYQPAAVMRDISFEVVAVLEEQNIRFPGVSYQIDRVRKFTEGLGTEAFTGYVGEVSDADLSKESIIDYRLGSMIGKKGLEKFYDILLRGREGTDYIEVSASGQIIGTYETTKKIPAITGADLTLTIDNDIREHRLTLSILSVVERWSLLILAMAAFLP